MRRILHKIHLWMGLIACVPLVLLGLSGSILVFQHELQDLFSPPPATTSGTAHSIDDILDAAASEAAEGLSPTMYRPPASASGMATVFLSKVSHEHKDGEHKSGGNKGGEGGGRRIQMLVDPVSLAVIDKQGGDWTRTVNLFHSSLLLRDYGGRSVVGWFGVAMVLFGCSGLILWWPGRHWRNAFRVRREARGWRFHREWHGATGIWSVAILLIVASTGVTLAFPQAMNDFTTHTLGMRDLRAPPPDKITPIDDQDPMSVDDAVKLAESAAPETHLVMVSLPSKPDQSYRIALQRSDGTTPINVFIDPWQKRILETRDPLNYTLGESMVSSLHAVHEGQAFGWPWRILVFVVGFLPLLFSITGVSMWTIKRRAGKQTGR